MKKYKRALTVASSDCGGGAGVQADLKTFSALKCFGTTAIAAITVQNTCNISSIFPMPALLVKEQIEAVLCDIGVDAIKIGMLYEKQIIEEVASVLPNAPIVLDPVMRAKSGWKLLKNEEALFALFPKALLVTPNLDEAGYFLQRKVESKKEMEDAAKALLALGAKNVLVKGGDSGCDCLLTASSEIVWFERPRIKTRNTHGTGCTYSAAIAGYLAHGLPLIEAIANAKQFLHRALEMGAEYELGKGCGPLYHFGGE